MKRTSAQCAFLSSFACGTLSLICAADGRWFAGSWDSTIYNRSEKPRTVAVRVEVSDAESGLVIQGARVRLTGSYLKERIGTAGNEVGVPYEAQEEEFSLEASTGNGGVVVFALSWQKEYPWLFGRPKPKVKVGGSVETADVHTSWTRVVDDVEKVKGIEIRHPGYRLISQEFDFAHLVEFGQDRRSEGQEPEMFERFEAAWHAEIGRPNVRFCVLDLGTGFADFGNRNCSRPEFFERIASKELGTVYTDPPNWFSVGEDPQSACGPYMVYLITIQMEALGEARQPGEVRIPAERNETSSASNWDQGGGGAGNDAQEEESAPRKGSPEISNSRTRRNAAQRDTGDDALPVEHRSPTDGGDEKAPKPHAASSDRPLGVVGARISAIDNSSPMYKAGLREGMIVSWVRYGNVNVTPMAEERFQSIIGNLHLGQRVELGVWRKSAGNSIKESYTGGEVAGKWYQDKIVFVAGE